MRILVVGAGALGGYFGARLLHAARDVTFLVRPPRAGELAASGIRLTSPRGDLNIPAPPTLLAEDLRQPFDLVLLTTKAKDLPAAMESFAPAIGPATAILPLLNGMLHMDLLDGRFGRAHVLGGGCLISATRSPDGVIRHLNALDRLFFGDRDEPGSARMAAIAATLCDAGFDAAPTPSVLHEMWQKWCFIASSAGITCLMRATVGDLVAAGAAPLALQLYSECASIAEREGFPVTAAARQQSAGYLTAPASRFTASMLRDLEAGAPIEAHQIIGDLLDHGRRHSLATPLLSVVHAHLRSYEERRARESAAV